MSPRIPPIDLESLLIADEGEVLHTYLDSRGILTLGVGRRVDKVGGISKDESRYLLSNDLKFIKDGCNIHFPWLAAQSTQRQAVVLSMAFIFGIRGLLDWKNFLAAVQAGDWEKAAMEMSTSKWAMEAPERVNRLAQQMRTGEWV